MKSSPAELVKSSPAETHQHEQPCRLPSRLSSPQFARAGIPAFGAALPPQARSLYFRDAIGNISSSGASLPLVV